MVDCDHARRPGAAGGQDCVRHCSRPEQGRCADRAGRARLVASLTTLNLEKYQLHNWTRNPVRDEDHGY
jgi:hypothetical protein